MDDELNPAFVVAIASTTVELHDAGRRCQCCTDLSCPQDAWARKVLAEHRATRQTTPTYDWPREVASGARRTA